MTSKSLILGGNGFIGGAIARQLVADGDRVVIMDRSYPNTKNIGSIINNVEYIERDFFNEKELMSGLDGVDNIFHCITSTYPGSANVSPAYDIETNLVGTVRLLEAVKNIDNIRIFFISSGGTVYGSTDKLPISEDHRTNPVCSYGICKLAIERYFEMYKQMYGLDYCIFRLANPYGETQDPRAGCGAITVFLDKIRHNSPIEVWGDGSVVRDYIHISDVVSAIVTAKNKKINKSIYNVGSGVGTDINTLLETIQDVVGFDIDVRYVKKRIFDVEKNCLDIGLISNELGWEPKIDINKGVSMMWDSMR